MTTSNLRLPLAGLLLATACGSSPSEPSADQIGLHATIGANVTDTVGAALRQALVMRVGDAQGRPVVGAVVRFQALSATSPLGYTIPNTQLTPLAGLQPNTFLADTTDADGHASALVTLGSVAGPAAILVTVPALALVDTVRYTVAPGAAARIVWSARDTAVAIGGHAAVRATVGDRYSNPRPESPAYSVNQYLVAVDGAGTVTAGGTPGAGYVRATYGSLKDSVAVTVVPDGRMVVLRTGEVGLVNTDGSGYVRVVATAAADFPAVNRARTQVAFHEYASTGYQQLFVVDVATGARRMLLDPNVIISAVHPRYSADGAYIYFAARRTLSVEPSIWRVHTDGTSLEEVVAAGTGSYTYPDPSPDGGEVAFTDLFTGRVVVKTLATGAMRTTTLAGSFPRYSPDGSTLATLSGSGTINLMAVDGSNARTIGSPAFYSSGGLTWCPNGTCLVWRASSGLAMTMLASGQTMDMGVNRDKSEPSF